MPAITVSAGYGTGGSQIARALSERFGYQLLDRAISSQVARQLNVSVDEAEEGTQRRGFVERFFGPLAAMSGAVVSSDEDAAIDAALIADNDQVFRQSAERIMHAALPGGAVILGRGGAAALHGVPGVLTVRLFGPRNRRIAHAARVEGVDVATAAERLPVVDKARAHYLRHLYNCDVDDPSLFDLQVDSTLIPTDTCVEIIALAFTAMLPT
jgi:cytidylate kinase